MTTEEELRQADRELAKANEIIKTEFGGDTLERFRWYAQKYFNYGAVWGKYEAEKEAQHG